jgi:hypothetical protein
VSIVLASIEKYFSGFSVFSGFVVMVSWCVGFFMTLIVYVEI